VETTLAGASPFPRHWVYGADGQLILKAGTTDWQAWAGQRKTRTPWGDEDSPVVVTAAETALERRLSTLIMRGGARPDVRSVPADSVLVKQGEPGDSLFLLLDGVVRVEVDGRPLAELGPGAVLGERAVLEGGRRTATLTAVTPVRVAEASGALIDQQALRELAEGHRREETPA
jgi:CRP-like cAMP-binding protein